jgi:hypothetical protein
MIEFQTVIAGMIVALFAALLGSVALLYSRIRAIELKVTELSVQVSPLWARMQSRIAAELHHPHPRYSEMDSLLEQLEALTITDEGRTRLKILLEIRSKDMHTDITPAQRSSAALMLGIMDKVLEESAAKS